MKNIYSTNTEMSITANYLLKSESIEQINGVYPTLTNLRLLLKQPEAETCIEWTDLKKSIKKFPNFAEFISYKLNKMFVFY